MPLLRNARHERFAQAIANGQTLERAHAAAGFKADPRNAAHIRKRDDVSRRIEEILTQRAAREERTLDRAASKAEIKRSDVLRMLIEDHQLAPDTGQLGPAIRAAELLGKELGMFIERHLQKQTDDIFEGLTDDELRLEVEKRMTMLVNAGTSTH